MYRLVFLTGKLKGRRLVIRQGPVTIGRDAECHIALDDDEVSRRHAVIEPGEDGVRIRDLGSMNGILINGNLVREARLKHNDTLEIGRTKIVYQLADAAEPPRPRRVSLLQVVTVSAVALVILLELGFLFGLSLWRRDVAEIPPSAAPAQPPPETAVPEAGIQEPAPPAVAGTGIAEGPAAATATPAQADVDAELRQLKEDVDSLRQQVQAIAEEQVAPVETSAPPPAPPPPAEAEAAEDPLTRKARSLLNEAALEIQRRNLVQADDKLRDIQILAPDFLPAYVERAKLLEQRGLLQKAGEQWSEVLTRSVGTPLYEQAAAERIRLARAEMLPPKVPENESAAARLASRIRIESVEPQRIPAGDQFDEMRLIRVALRLKPGVNSIDPADARVVVTFFDEDAGTREVLPTRAVVPREPIRIEGLWSGRETKTVTAAYVVPRGFREEEQQKHGEKRAYYGCVVQVYYREMIQDQQARPKSLLQEAQKIEPLHAAETPGDTPSAVPSAQ